ncbi:MAG: hypothetical protein HC786_11090 [Richelia sp. CSU_2_1]|nr:hypothetical protein [Richelia sp. CSU_2_1]
MSEIFDCLPERLENARAANHDRNTALINQRSKEKNYNRNTALITGRSTQTTTTTTFARSPPTQLIFDNSGLRTQRLTQKCIRFNNVFDAN